MVCQTGKSIEDVLRLALRITSEDERLNVRPGVKVSYFFRGENQNYQDREHDVYPSAGFKPGIYRNPKHLARETWFVNEAIRLFPEEFQSDHTTFERLTRLQHFGFPTRLADITQNLFVATAFACMKGYDDPAKLPADQRMGFVHIYRINDERIKYSTGDTVTALSKLAMLAADKIRLNDLNGLAYEVKDERPGFYWDDPREDETSQRLQNDIQKVWCVRPVMNNSRIKVQDGAFLLFGCKDKKACLNATFAEEDFYNPMSPTFGIVQIASIGIPCSVKSMFSRAKQFLGVDDQRIYPDLEKLAVSLKKEVGDA